MKMSGIERRYVGMLEDPNLPVLLYLELTSKLIDFHLEQIEAGVRYWRETFDSIITARNNTDLKKIINERYTVPGSQMPCNNKTIVQACMKGCSHRMWKRLVELNDHLPEIALKVAYMGELNTGIELYRQLSKEVAREKGYDDIKKLMEELEST